MLINSFKIMFFVIYKCLVIVLNLYFLLSMMYFVKFLMELVMYGYVE